MRELFRLGGDRGTGAEMGGTVLGTRAAGCVSVAKGIVNGT